MPKEKYLTRAAAPGKRKRMRDKAAGSESQPRSKKSTAKPVNGNRQNVSDDDDDDDEVIGLGSIDDMDLTERVPSEGESEDEGGDAFLETPAEKRLRLAKEYIAKMKHDLSVDADEFDAAKVDQDLIADRLVKDSLERSGKIHKIIAEYYSKPVRNADVRYLKNGHHLSVTCVVVTPNGKYVYSGSKDGSIVKWDFATGKRLKTFPGQKKTSKKDTSKGHRDQVLCLAVSSDSAYLASGGKDRQIHVWSIETDEHLVTFHQHKDSVTGLAFRRGQNQLYSCSLDRMVKLWNVDELAYAETLYGHQDGILAISTLQREQAVTVGSRDRNLRLWKVAEGVSHKFVAGTQTDPEKYLLSGKARQGNRGEGRTNDEDEEVSLAEDISSSESEGEEGLEGEPHVQEADTGTSMLQIIRHWD
ncbi:pre-rRNA processing protein, partial [Spiromyces aspiralis]